MASAASDPCVEVCCNCQRPSDLLVSSARGGSLVQVCQPCFHLDELRGLLRTLPQDDHAAVTAAEGLEALYQLVKNRVEERLWQAGRKHAS